MHITAALIRAVERGDISKEDYFDIVIDHLAEICSGCAEVLAAHEARLAGGEDPTESRRTLEWEFCYHALTSKWSACAQDHHHHHGPS